MDIIFPAPPSTLPIFEALQLLPPLAEHVHACKVFWRIRGIVPLNIKLGFAPLN